jgi:dTDP-4-dehydrorhamnose reductase
MRIVLTGAGGGLGRAFWGTCPGHHDLEAFTRQELDIGDHHAVMQTVVPLQPHLIVNAAAFTRVDACETERERAYRDNALGPQNLALAARACDAILVHVSTDFVFDGEKGEPYDELDAPNPRSVYARSKLGGEDLVRAATPQHFVVRTGYVFGGGTDWVTSQLRKMADGEPGAGLSDRRGTPTYVRHLAERLLPLALTGRFGTYHLGGPESLSYHELLLRAKAAAGLSGEVQEQRSEDLGLPARRPRDSSLASLFATEAGIPPMPALEEALDGILSGL